MCSMNKNLIAIIIIGMLLAVHCGSTDDVLVKVKSVSIYSDLGSELFAELYLPTAVQTAGAVILAMQETDRPVWRAFARKVAYLRYAVLAVSYNDIYNPQDSSYIHHMRNWIKYLKDHQGSNKIGLVAADAGSIVSLRIAAADTSIAALVLLSLSKYWCQYELNAELKKIKGRPVVFIAADRDRIVPSEQSRKFFEMVQEPKKLVWLASPDHGTDLLKKDMQPIVVRVATMLFDRYLKGKQ